MRTLWWLTPAMAALLAACQPSTTTTPSAPTADTPAPSAEAAAAPPPHSQQVPQAQTLHLVGPMDLTLTITTQDNFETATMTDNSDRRIALRSVPSGSGMRLEGPNGEVLHLKGTEGYVELVPGTQILVQEFQP